jgi:hypothetical protein
VAAVQNATTGFFEKVLAPDPVTPAGYVRGFDTGFSDARYKLNKVTSG